MRLKDRRTIHLVATRITSMVSILSTIIIRTNMGPTTTYTTSCTNRLRRKRAGISIIDRLTVDSHPASLNNKPANLTKELIDFSRN